MGIKQKGKKGFTIIEVVLVLAIAGLIFMMVFIALPALQKGQRDTQRKSDLSRLQTALTQYTSNNRGSLPSNWSDFEKQYLIGQDDGAFVDPLGETTSTEADSIDNGYMLQPSAAVLTSTFNEDTQNIIYYATDSKCASGGSLEGGAGNRRVAFRMYLEGGGVACQNN